MNKLISQVEMSSILVISNISNTAEHRLDWLSVVSGWRSRRSQLQEKSVCIGVSECRVRGGYCSVLSQTPTRQLSVACYGDTVTLWHCAGWKDERSAEEVPDSGPVTLQYSLRPADPHWQPAVASPAFKSSPNADQLSCPGRHPSTKLLRLVGWIVRLAGMSSIFIVAAWMQIWLCIYLGTY